MMAGKKLHQFWRHLSWTDSSNTGFDLHISWGTQMLRYTPLIPDHRCAVKGKIDFFVFKSVGYASKAAALRVYHN